MVGVSKSDANLIETASYMENTSYKIYELYPPENINSDAFQKEANSAKQLLKKEIPEQNEIKRYYSMTSFKSKDYIPPLMVEEEDFPTHFCQDDTFGVAIT